MVDAVHGPKNKSMKYSDDVSLNTYLGNKSPGKGKESNWPNDLLLGFTACNASPRAC